MNMMFEVPGARLTELGQKERALAVIAELALEVLDAEREATGVDEWDESDPRCFLYNAAYSVREGRVADVLDYERGEKPQPPPRVTGTTVYEMVTCLTCGWHLLHEQCKDQEEATFDLAVGHVEARPPHRVIVTEHIVWEHNDRRVALHDEES